MCYHDRLIKKGNIILRKLRRIFFILISICLLVVCTANLIPRAYAASTMTASASCVNFIKKVEGFSLHPYYDYSQHTVGYGTKCPTEKYFDYLANGIPESEAEALLQETLADLGNTINEKLIDAYNLTFSQHQFDALVSFSFNLGTAWMTYDSTLRNAILSNAGDDELVYAFSLYCTAGGNYSSGLVTRRLCEANMFLNGIYSQTPNKDHGYVFYEPNGGSLTYRVQGFVCENYSAPVADAVRSSDVFLGWYTDLTGGSQVRELSRALTGKTLFARWQSSENSDNQNSVSTLITVTGDVVNIRKGPGTNYGISSQVYRNDVLILSHITQLSNRAWGKVQNGWICLEYTNYDTVINGTDNTDSDTDRKPSEEVTVPNPNPPLKDTDIDIGISQDNQTVVSGLVCVEDLLRIRSGPGIDYPKVGYLVNGSKVEILEKRTAGSMVWGRITRGWISMDYIRTDDLPIDGTIGSDTEHKQESKPEQETSGSVSKNESATMNGKITADALRIRSGPGAVNPIVGFYYQNDNVVISETVLADSVYWGKTDRGWISMNYVLSDFTSNDDASANTGVKTVIADCLRIRKEIGTDSRIAALLYYGDNVTVLETKTVDGTVWGRVDRGWICMDYVS